MLTVLASLLTVGAFLLSGKVRLMRALRDCKQRSSTVSKKAPTVSKKASPLLKGSLGERVSRASRISLESLWKIVGFSVLLLLENLLRTLLRSVRLHDPLGVHPTKAPLTCKWPTNILAILRSSARAPTIKTVRGTVAIEGVFGKILLVSVKFVSAILGPEMGAPILWTPGKMRSFCRKNHVRKTPLFWGGFGGGGGECRFYFYGRADFSEIFLESLESPEDGSF